jgi:hypothetical protein
MKIKLYVRYRKYGYISFRFAPIDFLISLYLDNKIFYVI